MPPQWSSWLIGPTSHGRAAGDAFHLVIPSLPGYDFVGPAGLGRLGHRPGGAGLDHADELARPHRFVAPGR
jgi:hypothetical protein